MLSFCTLRELIYRVILSKGTNQRTSAYYLRRSRTILIRRSGYDKNDHIKGGDFYYVSHGISFILTALRIC